LLWDLEINEDFAIRRFILETWKIYIITITITIILYLFFLKKNPKYIGDTILRFILSQVVNHKDSQIRLESCYFKIFFIFLVIFGFLSFSIKVGLVYYLNSLVCYLH
jgi:hypothetical protein